MTALENVAVPLELALVPDAFDKARQELVNVGLEHRLDHYPSQLSGGEQQRVALARALAPRPSLIFADEPTGNLDGRTGAEIVEMLFKLQRERGSTLVLVTHDDALARRCDRIVRLRDGKIESIEDADQPQVEATVHFQPVIQTVSASVSVSPLVAEQVVQPPTEPDLNPTEAAGPVADPVPDPAPDTSPSAPPDAATPAGSEAPAPAPVPADAPFRLVEEDTVLTEVPDKPTQPPVAARAE
jgi:ABC-type sulfate/molybdate transport systems ATPase subunit